MAVKQDRIGIVGATTLLGKELSEELADSPFAAAEIVLLDEDVTEGQISAAGDEPSFLQTLDAESFRGLDVVFFAGSPEQTRNHWPAARRSGALAIDLTRALLGEPGVPLRAPAVMEARSDGSSGTVPLLSLETVAVVPAHPLAAALALLQARVGADLEQIAATVLLPASEHGRAALDELHQQTVNLLSFHELPREQFDAQSAFNLLDSFGDDAKVNLRVVEGEITADLRVLDGSRTPVPLLQLLQAPVFHGYGVSVLLSLREPTTVEQLAQRLRGRYVEVAGAEDDAPSNLAIAGRRELLLAVRGAANSGAQRQFWLWATADNLKLRAAGAIDCAVELRRLRPSGKVQ